MSWAFALSLISIFCLIGPAPKAVANPSVGKTRMLKGSAAIRGCPMAKQILETTNCDHVPHSMRDDCMENRRRLNQLNYECSKNNTPVRGHAETVTGAKHAPKEATKNDPKPGPDNRLGATDKQPSPSGADGQLGAFERGTNAVDAGIADNTSVAKEVNSAITSSRDLKVSELESAMTTLENIQNTFSDPTPVPMDLQSKLQQDQLLLTEAIQKVENGEPLDMAMARSANFPEVKTSLEIAAAASYLENEFSKEKEYLIEQGVVFASIYNQLQEAKSALTSEATPEATDAGGKITATNSNNLSSATLGRKLDSSNISPQEKSIDRLAQELTKAQKANPNAPIAKMNIAELQKKLREKMKEMKKSKREKESLAAFTGDLGSGTLGELTQNPSIKNSEVDPLDTLKKTFSLEGIETDQEVRRLQEEGARQLASSSGILLIDSKDLFERVNEYHRACLIRECVK